MSNIDSYLTTKYAILGQEAAARTTQANASANLSNAEAGAIPQKLALQAQDITGQNALRGAQASSTNVSAALAPGLAQSEIGLRGAQAGLYGQEAASKAAQDAFLDTFHPEIAQGFLNRYGGFQNPGAPAGTPPSLTPATGSLGGTPTRRTTSAGSAIYQFAGGTSRVKGPGGPTDDKVPAKLSAGEAVLNAAAAEHLGRPTIDLLNAVGAAKMGMGPTPTGKGEKAASGAENEVPGYARGTSRVPAKKSAAATAKAKPAGPGMKKGAKTPPAGASAGALTPDVIQAIMKLGQSGMPG